MGVPNGEVVVTSDWFGFNLCVTLDEPKLAIEDDAILELCFFLLAAVCLPEDMPIIFALENVRDEPVTAFPGTAQARIKGNVKTKSGITENLRSRFLKLLKRESIINRNAMAANITNGIILG